MSYHWPPYPPCYNNGYYTREACAGVYKYSWPELVGKKWSEAEAIIKKENPWVTVVLLDPHTKGFGDFCCNRVYIFVDTKEPTGIVRSLPQVG